MGAYIVRRLLASILILLAATFLMFVLMTYSSDPLAGIRSSNLSDADKALQIQARIDALNLDQPLPVRYFLWLKGAAGCVVPGAKCDLGQNLKGQDVTALLGDAMPTTLRLVLAATVLSILLGVAIGIVSALRQYSGFDYTITFAAFLFFALPIFWVAVLLKQFGAIKINDWLADPALTLPVALTVGAFAALLASAIVGGSRRQRLLVAGGAAVAAIAFIALMIASGWFSNPGLGPGVVIIGSALAAAFGTVLFTNLENWRVLGVALATAASGVVIAYAATPILRDPNWFTLFALGALATAVGVVIAMIFGGIDRPQAVRASVVTSLGVGVLVFADHTVSSFAAYSSLVNGRPIATIGNQTPNFSGTFWEVTLDGMTHLILPTMAIMLISFATYSRYSRSSMLENMNADYVRTARAKGLTERTVVLRHAFRNALIPIATLAALDFGALIGGAIITETVFGWRGMGAMFNTALNTSDLNQLMGFFVVTAIAVVIFNLIADISYAILDPRIRLS